MQTIEFRLVEVEFPTAVVMTVLPHIGGTPLTDLLHRVERPSATGRGGESSMSGYAGLGAAAVSWPNRHFLGEPALAFFPLAGGSEGDEPPNADAAPLTVLLGCECGDHGCGSVAARIAVEDDAVVWSGFRHGSRDPDDEDLWPLVFDRTQYEAALRATAAPGGGGGRVARHR